jgi:hypothetical protein
MNVVKDENKHPAEPYQRQSDPDTYSTMVDITRQIINFISLSVIVVIEN